MVKITITTIKEITILILTIITSLFLGMWISLMEPTLEINLIGIIFFSVVFIGLSILCFYHLLIILFDEEEDGK